LFGQEVLNTNWIIESRKLFQGIYIFHQLLDLLTVP